MSDRPVSSPATDPTTAPRRTSGSGRRRSAQLVTGLLGVSLLMTAGCGITGGGDSERTLTASFARTVGLYPKSDVRILGVRIGEVTSLTPHGDTVTVKMKYDDKYKIPEGAKAVVVAPSIVSDRYVQLTPAYTGGAVMASGAVLPVSDTAVPVELDQIFQSVDTLNVALGPDGANRNGALSRLLGVSAANLGDNGMKLGSTVEDFSKAVQTLSDNRQGLFDTVTNLQDFTTTIAKNDVTVRAFNKNLAAVSSQLSGERDDLAQATKQLAVALDEVASFVRENKTNLTANVKDLASVTQVLVKQKKSLEEFLTDAPAALENLQLAYNPNSGTLDTRLDMTGTTPQGIVCGLLDGLGTKPVSCNGVVGVPTLPLPGGTLKKPATTSTAPSTGATSAPPMTITSLLGAGR